MNFEQIFQHLDQSVTLRLLRTDQAALALGFFFHAFKQSGRLQIPYSELELSLNRYLENLDSKVRDKFPHHADHYLTQWCDDKHRFIRRYYELNSDEPKTELTYDAERAIEFMHNLEKKDFVGAQSRFLNVFESLRDLVEQADENPTTRIEQLKAKRKQIDREMEKIRTTGQVSRLDDTNVRERFLNIIEDSRRMLTDFRLIEDIFKDLTHEVKIKRLKPSVTKGAIVGEVLDAYDTLEESHQGKTFDAFWSFLNSPEQQTELKQLSERVLQIQEVKDLIAANPQRGYDQLLMKLKHQLSQVGLKVLKSRTRLSDELRKLLKTKSIAENHQVVQEIEQIKRLALQIFSERMEPASKDFVMLDYLPRVQLALERPLWQPSAKHDYHNILVQGTDSDSQLSTEKMLDLRNSFNIDLNILRKRVSSILGSRSRVTLSELVQIFPVEFGTSELVGYMKLSSEYGDKAVRSNEIVSVSFTSKFGNGIARMPDVTFLTSGLV